MKSKRTKAELQKDLQFAERRIAELENALKQKTGGVNDLLVSDQTFTKNDLRKSQEYYKVFFENNPHPMWVYDLETLAFLTVNDAAIVHYGFSREEFLKMSILDIRPLEDHQQLLENVSAITSGLDEAGIWRHLKKDGTLIYVEISSHTLEFDGRKAEMVLANDVTKRIEADSALQASEANYRNLVENSESAIAVVDREGKVLFVNAKGVDIWNDKKMVGKFIYDIFPAEYAERYAYVIRSVIDTQIGILDEVESSIAGRMMWFRLSMTPLKNPDGTVSSLLVNAWDITDRILVERSLRENEEKYRTLINSTGDGVFVAQDEKFVFCNAALPAMLSYTREEFENLPIDQVLVPEHVGLWMDRYRRRVLGEKVISNYQVQFQDKANTKRIWVELRANRIEYGGRPAVLGIVRDITEQKKILEEMENLAKFPAENPGLVMRIDLHGKLLYANQASFALMTEWDLKIGKPAPELLQKAASLVIESGMNKTIEAVHKGRIVSLDLILLSHGEYINIYGHDITELRHAEETVYELQKLSQATIDALSSHLCVLDENGVVILVNRAWRKFADANPPIPLNYGIGSNYLKICENASGEDGEIAHAVEEGLREMLAGRREQVEFEYPCHSPGEHLWFYLVVRRFEINGVVRLVLSHENITRRKEIEFEISDTNQRFKELAENVSDIFWISEPVTRRSVYVSPVFAKVMGMSIEGVENLPNDFLDLVVPEDQHIVVKNRELEENGFKTDSKYRICRPDGLIRWIHDKATPVFNEEGKVVRIVGIASDITEQILADEALKDSEERLRLSLAAGQQGLYDLNLRTGKAIVNDEYAEMLGYDPKTFVETNQNWLDRVHPDDKEATQKAYFDYIHGLSSEYRIEFRQRTKDGKWKWILSIGKVVEYDANGSPVRMLGTHTDIDANKQAESELQRRAAQLALINDVGREITGILDIQGVLDLSARLVHESFGYHHVGLFTINDEKSHMLMRAKAGKYAPLFPENHRINLGEGIVGSVAQSGEMILTNQAAEDTKYKNFFPEVLDTISELGLPIKIAGQVIGVLDVQSPHPNAFTADDIRVLQTLADQVAIALENARLYESVQEELIERKQAEKERQKLIHDLGERVKELTALHQASRLFQDTSLSEAMAMQSLVNILPPAWQYPELTVARIRVGKDEYITPGFKETKWMQKKQFSLPDGREGEIEVAYIAEMPEDVEGPFLREERELLETLVEKLQSSMARQFMEKSLRNRTKDLSSLVEAGRALSETLNPKAIYPLIYRYVSEVMPCDFIVVSSYNADTQLIHCEYLHSIEGPLDVSNFPPISLEPPGQGTQSRVIRSGESLHLPDYEKALKTAATSMYFNEKGELFEEASDDEERTRSAIIVPLKVNGLVTGILQVLSTQLNAHTQNHLRFTEALAFHVSAALSNAQLFSELEERVRQRTAEVRDLYDNSPAGYHSLDGEGKITLINQTELNWLGYSREEMIGHFFSKFLMPDSISVFQETFPIFKYHGTLNNLELEMRRKDGSILSVLVNATAIKDEEGNYLMSRSTLMDNTERKKNELALREREEIYRALFESANDAIFMLEPGGKILGANPRSSDLLGVSHQEMLGRNALDFIADEESKDAESQTDRLLAGEKLPIYERTFMRNDGKKVETEINLSLIRDETGKPKFIQSVVRDISARKHAEETLRLANAEMERALRLKDEFLANMSHELRTPLNAILGITESLLEQISGTLNEKQQKYLQTVLESAQHLLELINDILDLAKINAGRIDLDINKVDIQTVAQTSLRMIRELAQKKGLDVKLEVDPDIKSAWADERRLKQMLVNLLSNAVKFTPKGGDIGLMIRGNRTDQVLNFTVWDTGIGIKEEDIRHLFQPFVQLDASLSRGSQGTGLGLVLVSQMARLHGGGVFVKSKPQEGSSFTISIPWVKMENPLPTSQIMAVPPSPVIQPASEAIKDQLILLVEDTEAVNMLISDYLKKHGYKVVTARDGIEGIARIHENVPDLILMDIMMPELDGLETTRRIRDQMGLLNIPIIALTALAMAGDRERCLEAGMNDYLSKPVKLKELLNIIDRYLKPSKEGHS